MSCFSRLLWPAALLWLASPAQACMSATENNAYIHSALPRPLPPGAIVAEVEIERFPQGAAADLLEREGLRARVRRMLQGDHRGQTIVVRPFHWTSCDLPFANGRAGFLVGVVHGTESGVPVVHPITAPSGSGYRLADGYRIDDRIFEHARRRAAALPPERSFPSTGAATWGILLLAAAAVAAWAIRARRRRRRRASSDPTK